MNGDVPVDPNQMLQLDDEARRIEVTSQDGDAQLGEVALAANSQVEDSDQGDQPADQQEVPDSFIRNKDKAEEMARAHNDALDAGEEYPESAALRASIDHDMKVAEEKVKGGEPNKADKEKSEHELDVYRAKKRNQILRYSDAIVEHYKQTGDKPSLSLQALASVHKLVKNSGSERFGLETHGDFMAADMVWVTLDRHGYVVIETGDEQKNKCEKFELSMFHGSRHEITQESFDRDIMDDFDEAVITKRRQLSTDDVKRLEEIVASALEFEAELDRENDEHSRENDDERFDEDPDDDRYVSSGEILHRAIASMGNTEEAHEAARLFPGDFM